ASKDSPPSDTTLRVPATPSTRFGDVRVVHDLDWPDPWGAQLIGVDVEAQRVFVRLEQRAEPKRFAIDTVDLVGGTVERWSALAKRASALVDTYPRFRPISGTFQGDLIRFTNMLESAGPWSHRETATPLAVTSSPAGTHVIHSVKPTDGRDGDWLTLTDIATGDARRLDKGMRASYHANFSFDGQRVAFIGGAERFARRGQHIGYVLHVAALRGTARPIPGVRDVLRKPMWSVDGGTVWAVGRGKTRASRCLFAVPVGGTFTPRALMCHEQAFDVVLDDDTQTAMLLLQPSPPDPSVTTRELVWLDLASGEVKAKHRLPEAQGIGVFGAFLGPSRALFFTNHGARLIVMSLASGAILHDADLSAPETSFLGRHTTRVVGDEVILLRRVGKRAQVVAVRIEP
ncbi:MAG: hypothetical protein AAGI01_16520, partial [Myxococcota bacterium]